MDKKLIVCKELNRSVYKQHMVSDNHTCSYCGKGKDEVSFYVSERKGRKTYINHICSTCIAVKKSKGIVKLEEQSKIDFKRRFKEYWKSYAKE